MGDITLGGIAYAKIILHAHKYPHCAVNGVLLAEKPTKERSQDLEIENAMPLLHHSHYVTPMAEVALTQIEVMAQARNKIIVGYYAACENFRDKTVEKCPGQKIAEKIAEFYPSAVFIVVDNEKLQVPPITRPALVIYRWSDGKWKPKANNDVVLNPQNTLEAVSKLLKWDVQKDLVDFDDYLDDCSLDWTNSLVDLACKFDMDTEGFDGSWTDKIKEQFENRVQ